MLRISENCSSDESTILRLEGQMIGAGVVEVEKVCEQRLASGGKLTLDLADLLFVDRSGIALLRELTRRQVTIANCSPFVAEQLKET